MERSYLEYMVAEGDVRNAELPRGLLATCTSWKVVNLSGQMFRCLRESHKR
jgi:hypothetical protein